MHRPIEGNITQCTLNTTLHGRSVNRQADVKGHNVFIGFDKRNGDAVDVFLRPGSPIHAMHDGYVYTIQKTGNKSRVWLNTANGMQSMYAHIKPKATLQIFSKVKAGDVIGYVGDALEHPHLHLEVWVKNKAISGKTAEELVEKINSFIK